jgi:hypothetical protein
VPPIAVEDAREPQRSSRWSWRHDLGSWLSNPLLITVVAALLGSWLIPQLTRDWQDHQKALEIKTGLVSEMSKSVGDAVATSRFIASGLIAGAEADPHAEQRAWNSAYRDWTSASASIGAKLEAYVGAQVGSEWRSFADAVENVVLLSARNDLRSRRLQVERIYDDANVRRLAGLTVKEWRQLAQPRSSLAFRRSYEHVTRALLARRDELVERVLDSDVSGF